MNAIVTNTIPACAGETDGQRAYRKAVEARDLGARLIAHHLSGSRDLSGMIYHPGPTWDGHPPMEPDGRGRGLDPYL
jgi:hypothetical protein